MEAIGQLSGGIAHDFNNILMIVLGNLEHAERQAKSAGAANPNLQRAIGRRAQHLRPELRVLYMTGYSRNAVTHQGRLDAGVELLQKPIAQTHLATRIRDLLDQTAGRS